MSSFYFFLRLPHSFFVVLSVLFIGSILVGGNQDRIGISFISLNALFSFLLIGWALIYYPSPVHNRFWLYLLFILIFALLSGLLRNESIIPIYSTVGNLVLAYAMYKAVNYRSAILISFYSFVLFSLVFVAFYVPGVWRTFGNTERLSFMGMNPNVVAEYVTLGFLSGIALVYRSRRAWSGKIMLMAFFLIALIPLLSTVSRKGIALFFLCLTCFYVLKYRKWNIASISMLVIIIGVFLFISEEAIVSGDSLIASHLEERFYGTYREDAATRQLLIVNSIEKGMEKPIFGHGLESSRDPQFLKAIGLWDSFRKSAINTHNGFVNIFLKGGLVFVILHLAVFYYVFNRLFHFIKIMRDHILRDLGILAFIYSVIFLAHILSSGNGELFKLGWFYLGLAGGVIRLLEERVRLQTQLFRQ